MVYSRQGIKAIIIFLTNALWMSVLMGSERGERHEHCIVIHDTTHNSEREKKVNSQKKWITPTHQIPIIQCSYSPNEEIGTTLMFLADAYRREDHASYYMDKHTLDAYEEILQDHMPGDVRGVVMYYLGKCTTKELDSNSWIPFKEHIGIPSLMQSITTLNPTDLYETCMTKEQYHFSEEWLKNAQHSIIKMKLNDLNALCSDGTPYTFTMVRKILDTASNGLCVRCNIPCPIKQEQEEALWLTQHVDDSGLQNFTAKFKKPQCMKVSCASCKQTSTVWYVYKMVQYPQLLMILLFPKDKSCRAKLPSNFTLGEASFNLCSVLGQTTFANTYDTIPYIASYNQKLCFWDAEWHINVKQHANDQPLAALYQLQEKNESPATNTPSLRKSACENCIIL